MIMGSVSAAVIKDERSLERNQFNRHQLQLPLETDSTLESNFRPRRALIFRPLFVYKEQEVRRTKLKEQRQQHRQQMQGMRD